MAFIRIALISCLLGCLPVQAHEFWFAPVPSPQAVGGSVLLRLEVGEFFTGEPAGFSIPSSQGLLHITAKERQDLRPFLPPKEPEAEVALALDEAGTHLLAYDSAPRRITLAADKFHAYLHDEGLDFVKKQREQAGTADQPGRERYRRHIKTLVQAGLQSGAGAVGDTTYSRQVGQRLEIIPLRNPLVQAVGEALPIKIVFDNHPLVGALVKAWHKHDGQLLIIRATTSDEGVATFNLPYAGGWMLSVVHMIPALDEEGVDWDSFWGNLSFHVAPLTDGRMSR